MWLDRYGPDTPRAKEVRRVGKYGKAERIGLDAYYVLLSIIIQAGSFTIGDILNFYFDPIVTVNIEPGDYEVYCLAYYSDMEPTDKEFELSREDQRSHR